jgi:predicted Zn-dependent protease
LKIAGQYREAYTTYGEVLQLEPTTEIELEAFDDALYKMAALDITMGAHQRAAEMLESLIEEHPDHPSAHYAYGQALLQLGRPDEAQREFETHMRILAQIEPTTPMASGQ